MFLKVMMINFSQDFVRHNSGHFSESVLYGGVAQDCVIWGNVSNMSLIQYEQKTQR